MQEEQFTPQYLKKLRIIKNEHLDMNEVERVKTCILNANDRGEQSVEIPFRLTVNWRKVNEFFESLGFWVGSAGYTRRMHDEDGKEVYYFTYLWHIEEE